MKRAISLLLTAMLCLGLFACAAKQEPAQESTGAAGFPTANFNNSYQLGGDFWAFDDHVFYMQDGFYNMGVYWRSPDETVKLLEESDFIDDSVDYANIRDIFVSGGDLYFRLSTDLFTQIYRYDLSENTYTPVCQTPYLFSWAVMDDYLVYREHPANYEPRRAPLWICDLNTGTATQICEDVEEFGIVDGQLRYITCADAYTLYAYDPAQDSSSVLGAFTGDWEVFNFTTDAVVMYNWNRDRNRELGVYTLRSGTATVYTMPRGIQFMAAGDRYAYAVIYDTQKNSSSAVASGENGIYRIDLTDGSYRVVNKAYGSGTELYVASDDRIYIIQGRMGFLFRYRTHVYILDCETGHMEKLTTLP